VIVFDGVCNLCNAGIDFIIRRDRAARFTFASSQSSAGQELLIRAGLDPIDADTIVLFDEGEVWLRSSAVLRIARQLGRPWRWAYHLRLIPRFLRDPVYGLVAATRYRVFGKRETCRLPTAAERSRFLD
jgi:predicted DCC family thiol-disulfide oxidoreductase YuxK